MTIGKVFGWTPIQKNKNDKFENLSFLEGPKYGGTPLSMVSFPAQRVLDLLDTTGIHFWFVQLASVAFGRYYAQITFGRCRELQVSSPPQILKCLQGVLECITHSY